MSLVSSEQGEKTMAIWSKYSSVALDKALTVAKGAYQRNLLLGIESLSGSTLKGKARQYGARYAESRRNLLARVRAAGVVVSEERASRNRRILVLS